MPEHQTHSISGSSHLLLPLPRMLFPQKSARVIIPSSNATPLQNPCLTSLSKVTPTLISLLSYHALVFFIALIPSDILNICLLCIIYLPSSELELHESQSFVCSVPCYIPSTERSAWNKVSRKEIYVYK